MALVRLEISATPAHVRTARLVATALARRSGVSDTVLDEIRLAVGEACSRAVSLHRAHAPESAVRVTLDDGGPFAVTVYDEAPVGADPLDVDPMDLVEGSASAGATAPDLLPPGFGLAVISGLVEDLSISATPDRAGTQVRMQWPMNPGGHRSA